VATAAAGGGIRTGITPGANQHTHRREAPFGVRGTTFGAVGFPTFRVFGHGHADQKSVVAFRTPIVVSGHGVLAESSKKKDRYLYLKYQPTRHQNPPSLYFRRALS
jgi:hypothetical protein